MQKKKLRNKIKTRNKNKKVKPAISCRKIIKEIDLEILWNPSETGMNYINFSNVKILTIRSAIEYNGWDRNVFITCFMRCWLMTSIIWPLKEKFEMFSMQHTHTDTHTKKKWWEIFY